MNIGYQGNLGSFSEQALRTYFGSDVKAHAFHTFSEVLSATVQGRCEYAIIPIENTSIGTIYDSYDLLVQHPSLTISGEIVIRIEHNLIGMHGTKLEEIKEVYSQLPGLSQCRNFLEQHPSWRIVPFHDTAAAVSHVATQNTQSYAAIGSRRAAELYGLQLLVENIEDNLQNKTRFAVLQKQDAVSSLGKEEKHLRAIIVFTISDKPGVLFSCLKVLADSNINMHKIESRPIPDRAWEYLFYVELDLHDVTQEQLQDVFEQMKQKTSWFHSVGVFSPHSTA